MPPFGSMKVWSALEFSPSYYTPAAVSASRDNRALNVVRSQDVIKLAMGSFRKKCVFGIALLIYHLVIKIT